MGSLNIEVPAKKELIDKYGEEFLIKLATQGFPDSTTRNELDEKIDKLENLKLEDGRTIEDLILELIELGKQEDKEGLILKIIELVRIVEREVNGLNDELISYKYTHGHCITLTTLITSFRRELQGLKTMCKCIGDGGYSHVVVRMKNPDALDGFLYYDINGQKEYYEMEDFITENLMTEQERKNNNGQILSCETYETNNDNVITALITKKLYDVLEKQKGYII